MTVSAAFAGKGQRCSARAGEQNKCPLLSFNTKFFQYQKGLIDMTAIGTAAQRWSISKQIMHMPIARDPAATRGASS